MTDPCARSVTWGADTYPLTLNNPWVRNVLSFCGINGKQPATCLAGFEIGAYSIDDVERILELGLIGAGVADQDRDKLLDQHVRTKPIGENARAAADALAALYVGAPQ
jgi:hypothetical protein